MKEVLALSAITILLFSSITSLTQTPSKQMAFAQTVHADFNFAAAGDWGCGSNARSTIKNIIDKKPELVLGLGDYSYNNSSASCWLKIVNSIDEKMKIAIGNHENINLPFLKQYMNHFNLKNQYYSFNYQNVHFTVMSTELPYGVNSDQYNFVNNDLLKQHQIQI
jgi:phosphodiesterase/alkaline phosphatase D-like protein